MADIITRRKVLEMRQRGLSYIQIKKEINISKSTLSLWLKNYPLNAEQLNKLCHNDAQRERYMITRKAKKVV